MTTAADERARDDVSALRQDVLSLAVDVAALRRDLSLFRTEVRTFLTEQRSVNATLVDLLSNLVGRKAEEA